MITQGAASSHRSTPLYNIYIIADTGRTKIYNDQPRTKTQSTKKRKQKKSGKDSNAKASELYIKRETSVWMTSVDRFIRA